MLLKSIALTALALATAAPAAAYTLTGTVASGGGSFNRPLTFYRDGDLSITVKLTSASGFAVSSTSALYYLNLVFYDFFDPQTGEPQGGNDNFGADEPWQFFGEDDLDPLPSSYSFNLDYTGAQVRRDYVSQNPGDPFPYEIGYTETLLSVRGDVYGNADLVNYTITVGGSAVVPEPATWALLIGGFGVSGAMLRRRRAAAA